MTVYISPVGLGLGDLVLSLPAIQALIEGDEPVTLVARTSRHMGLSQCIPGLAGVIDEPSFLSNPISPGDRYINLRDHHLQTEFRWDTPEFAAAHPGFKIIEILEGICADFGIAANFRQLKPLPWQRLKELEGKVLFIPGSAQESKCWLSASWRDLSLRLKSHRGRDCLVLGEPDKSAGVRDCLAMGLGHYPTPSIDEALNALSSAAAVVSVDTGLMHLALQQGTPTVALYLHNPVYLRRSPLCFALAATACHPECIRLSMARPLNSFVEYSDFPEPDVWECALPASKRCMSSITVEAVFAQASDALALRGSREKLKC